MEDAREVPDADCTIPGADADVGISGSRTSNAADAPAYEAPTTAPRPSVREINSIRHPQDFVEAVERACYLAGLERSQGIGSEEQAEVDRRLLEWAGDERTLRVALIHLKQQAGQAPGTDGRRLFAVSDCGTMRGIRC